MHARAVAGASLLACVGLLGGTIASAGAHAAGASGATASASDGTSSATGASGTSSASGATSASGACAGSESTPDGRNAALVDAATLCLMNEIRVAHGLHPLRRNGALTAIATGQARDMVRGAYFGDQSLSGQTPLARIMASSYPLARSRLLTAQNIGWGTGPNATPAGIVSAWMQSPPHRAIILTAAYRDVGVGVAPSVPAPISSGWSGATYAVEFGARRR